MGKKIGRKVGNVGGLYTPVPQGGNSQTWDIHKPWEMKLGTHVNYGAEFIGSMKACVVRDVASLAVSSD